MAFSMESFDMKKTEEGKFIYHPYMQKYSAIK